MVILRLGHPVAGRRGAGAPTAAKDRVGRWVAVASRWWRCLPVVGSMTLDHRPDRARRPDRRNATAPSYHFWVDPRSIARSFGGRVN